MENRNEIATSITKGVFEKRGVSYGHLYREDRFSKCAGNIDGLSIKFYNVQGKKLKKVLKKVNKLFKRAGLKCKLVVVIGAYNDEIKSFKVENE